MILFVIPLSPSNLSLHLSNLDRVTQRERGQRTNAKQKLRGGNNKTETEREKEVLVRDKQTKTRIDSEE